MLFKVEKVRRNKLSDEDCSVFKENVFITAFNLVLGTYTGVINQTLLQSYFAWPSCGNLINPGGGGALPRFIHGEPPPGYGLYLQIVTGCKYLRLAAVSWLRSGLSLLCIYMLLNLLDFIEYLLKFNLI